MGGDDHAWRRGDDGAAGGEAVPDIACGDCQPLGVPLSSGGPYFALPYPLMEVIKVPVSPTELAINKQSALREKRNKSIHYNGSGTFKSRKRPKTAKADKQQPPPPAPPPPAGAPKVEWDPTMLLPSDKKKK